MFAFPSFREATGTVLVEALGAGVPCVAFDAFGAREVLKGSPECLVALCPTYEETVGSFAKAIETVSRCSVEQSLTPMDWRAQFGSFSNLYTRGLEPEEL